MHQTRIRSNSELFVHADHCLVYRFSKNFFIKSKNAAGQVLNVTQVKIQFVQTVNINQARSQEVKEGINQIVITDDCQQVRMFAQILSDVLFCLFFCLFDIL